MVDSSSLVAPGRDRGLGRYAREILHAYSLLPDTEIVSPQRPTHGRPRHDPANRLPRSASIVRHALAPSGLPVIKTQPWVCSILDTIPLDLSDYRRLGVRSRLTYHNARRADLILALSQFTAERVRDRLGVLGEQVSVVSLPVTETFRRAPDVDNVVTKKHLQELRCRPFVVALVDGRTPDPRKRYHWIGELKPELDKRGLGLVVCGRPGPYADLPGHWIESPTDTELAAIYRGAVGMFYPSAYEGQGMPPLEAMAAGCPVLAFENSAVTEMISVPEFVMRDPSPWQSGRTRGPLSTEARAYAGDIFESWASAPEGEQERRRQTARLATRDMTRERMVNALAKALARLGA